MHSSANKNIANIANIAVHKGLAAITLTTPLHVDLTSHTTIPTLADWLTTRAHQ